MTGQQPLEEAGVVHVPHSSTAIKTNKTRTALLDTHGVLGCTEPASTDPMGDSTAPKHVVGSPGIKPGVSWKDVVMGVSKPMNPINPSNSSS